MDVKSVANTQTAQQLHTQSVELAKQQMNVQKVKENHQQDESQIKQMEKVSPELIEKVIEELKKKLSMLNTQLQIQIDKDTDITVVKVIDKDTKKVIRQIPPEYVLKIAKYLDEIAGLLLNEKA